MINLINMSQDYIYGILQQKNIQYDKLFENKSKKSVKTIPSHST